MKRWKFQTESKDWEFYINAENVDAAFDIAESNYGPQVEDMLCSQVNPDFKMYDDVTTKFNEYMKKELEANYLKGDRNGSHGWLRVKDNKFWISELYYHVGKLQSALMNEDVCRIEENCADIANLALMTLDVKINLLDPK